ncbi:DUF3267 domain-containing protein [Halomarina rubra]|uniref:DUF3267 domain-containing protein n=1 Tax=Halomarina rubra TaxID=2071873 RepID=A0ABD6AXW3_9EURY|nr:DUF3267 domain-containing protein [Halomarina rubra]
MTSTPTSPRGYQRYRKYPIGPIPISLLSIGLALVPFVMLPVVSVWEAAAEASPLLTLGTLLLIVPLVIVHELIHAVVERALGYEPTIRWRLWNPYVVANQQAVTRWDNIAILLAPLVVINVVMVALLSSTTSPILIAAYVFVLLCNTTIAAGDVAGAVWLLIQPTGTIVYVDDTGYERLQLFAHPTD